MSGEVVDDEDSQAEEVAYDRLSVIFGKYYDNPRDDFPIDEALSLLREHPVFVRIRFPANADWLGDESPCESLHFFIRANATLDVIQELVRLDPLASYEAAEAVYRFGCRPGVLEFCVRQLASMPRERIRLQFLLNLFLRDGDVALERSDDEKIEIAELFINADAETIFGNTSAKRVSIYGKITGCALSGDFGTPVMHYLYREYAKRLGKDKELSIRNMDTTFEGFGVPQAVAVTMLLSCCKTLECIQDDWTINGAICLLDAIGENTTIESLHLNLPSNLFEGGHACSRALEVALGKNTTITSLQHSSTEEDGADDFSAHAVMTALTLNRTIESFMFADVTLSDPRQLSAFLSQCQIQEIVLQDVSVLGPWHDFSFQPNCKIRSLKISCCESIFGLLSQLHNMPQLRELSLFCSSDKEESTLDITQPLSLSLGAAHGRGSLEKIEISGVDIDPDVLRQILQNNNISLKHLSLVKVNCGAARMETLESLAFHLEHHSTSLVLIESNLGEHYMKSQRKIDYYVALNQHGWRAKAQSPNITLPIFSRLLCEVMTTKTFNPAIDEKLQRHGANGRHSVMFGLLRMLPHLWSAPTQEVKGEKCAIASAVGRARGSSITGICRPVPWLSCSLLYTLHKCNEKLWHIICGAYCLSTTL